MALGSQGGQPAAGPRWKSCLKGIYRPRKSHHWLQLWRGQGQAPGPCWRSRQDWDLWAPLGHVKDHIKCNKCRSRSQISWDLFPDPLHRGQLHKSCLSLSSGQGMRERRKKRVGWAVGSYSRYWMKRAKRGLLARAKRVSREGGVKVYVAFSSLQSPALPHPSHPFVALV